MQHGPGGRHDQAGAQSVTAHIGNGQRQAAIGQGHDVVIVAPHRLGRLPPGGQFIPGHLRQPLRQKAGLNVPRRLERLLQLARLQHLRLQRLAAERGPDMGGECLQQMLVVGVEQRAFVPDFEHAQHAIVPRSKHRHRQDVVRGEPGLMIGRRVPAGIGFDILNCRRLTVPHHPAHNPMVDRMANFLDHQARGDTGVDFPTFRVVEEQAGALGPNGRAALGRDDFENPLDVVLGRKATRHLDQAGGALEPTAERIGGVGERGRPHGEARAGHRVKGLGVER